MMGNKLRTYKWTETINSLYMVILFLAFPLYYQNNYINMLEAKTALFVPATLIYLVVGVLSIVLVKLSTYTGEDKVHLQNRSDLECDEKTNGNQKWLLLQDIFFIVFVVSVVLATLSSGDIENAWLAPECKMFGTKILLLCCGIYVLAARGYVFNKVVKGTMIVGVGVVLILTILNRYGIDPLDMYSNLVEYQKHKYMSTIGNANILSNFICIFIPVFLGLFIYAKDIFGKIIYGIMVYMVVAAGIATNSDSFFLGLIASVIFFLWFALTEKKAVISYLIMLMLCAVAPWSLRLFNELSSFDYKWYNLQRELIYNVPWLIIIIILAALLILVTKTQRDIEWKRIRTIAFVAVGVGLIVLIVLIFRANTGNVAAESKYFTFSDEWGTNRGFVWSRTCDLFSNLPLYQQMMGIGPGEFRNFFESFNYQRAAMGLPDFADPHSEVLYYY